jgi:Domain of unknown function (DUF4349)
MTPAVLAWRGALTGAVLLSGCLLLSACGGSGASSSSSGNVRGPASVPAEGRPASAGLNVPATQNAAGKPATDTAKLAPADQSIIYTASLTVRASNVAGAAKRAVGIAVAAGGYTADENATSGTPGHIGRTVNLTLKVPVPAFQAVLTQLSSPAEGKQVSMQQQATDVTQEVANVNSLVTSQEDAIAALQKLLGRAGSVSGLLEVQRQISTDESTLNSLQAQQQALDHETAYATVTMTVLGPHHKAPPPRKPARHGFAAGLAAGWRALRHATAWVLTAFGALLPFLAVIAALGAIGYALWRRAARKRARPPVVS